MQAKVDTQSHGSRTAPADTRHDQVGLAFGDELHNLGKVTDGRDSYMRDTICAVMNEYIGTNGAAPTPEELCDEAWPQYERNVDLSRPGHGRDEFMDKCRYAVERFERGEIAGMRSLDEAVATYQAKQCLLPLQPIASLAPLISATPFEPRDPRSIPRRRFLYGRHYIRQFVSTTVAPGGAGKSSLAVVEALAMATGRNLLGRSACGFGSGMARTQKTRSNGGLRRRAFITGLIKQILRDRCSSTGGRDKEIVIAQSTRDGITIARPLVKALTDTIASNQIDVMVIDPFVSSHQVPENENVAIDKVARIWARVADATCCGIELIHHARDTNGNEVTVEDGRGASALLSAARSGRAINTMIDPEATKAGVRRRRLHFRQPRLKVPNGLNSSPCRSGMDHELFDNSDQVAVVTKCTWPDLLAGISARDADAVFGKLSGRRWRYDPQATDWVGRAVAELLGLDPGEKHEKAKIKAAIEMWVRSGRLKIVTGKVRGEDKDFVEVAPPIA